MVRQTDAAGTMAVVFASIIWGGSFALTKIALNELPVAHVVLYRFAVAAVLMVPILLSRKGWPARKDLPLFVLTGFLMIPVTFLLQFGGLVFTSVTSAALMVGTTAPLFAVAAVMFAGEKLTSRSWIAVGVSSLGVLLLVGLPAEGSDWLGNLLVFLSILVSVVWVLTSKKLAGDYPAFHATGWIVVFGTLLLLPIALVLGGVPQTSLSFATWTALLALGLVCTVVAYALWNWGVVCIGAGKAGIYANLEPITGAALGIVALGDPLTGGMVGGGTLIIAAAVMVSTTATAQTQTCPSRRASEHV